EPLFGSLDFLAPLDVSSLSFAVESSGAMQLRATTPNPTRVTEALGRGQIFVSQALGQLNAKASPELQGWVTYANRLTQAVFGRVSVTATEDSIDLSLPPPACG